MSENKAGKTILILNGSHSEIPLILAAKELGFKVMTTGFSPKGIGHEYADEYHNADISDYHSIYELAKQLGIDAICSSAHDFGAIASAYVAEKMGLSGHDAFETSLILHHKDRFKRFALKHNIPTPYARSYDSLDEALAANSIDFPVIVKPVDLGGGKGISVARSSEEYKRAARLAFSASHIGRIVVEDFIAGSQHSLTTFLYKGRIVFYFCDDEHSFKNPYMVSTSSAPATYFESARDTLIEALEKTACRLSLVDGILHAQYIMTAEGPKIIELTRRCSGDLYPYPVQKATGVNWAGWIVKAEAGLDISDFPMFSEQKGFVGRHCIMSPSNGIVEDVVISSEISDNIYDQMMWWKKGDVIDNFVAQKLGVLLLQFSSQEEMQDKILRINEFIRVGLR